MIRRLTPIAALALLAAPAAAQRSFLIDAQNGSGAHYTTIAAGLAAAKDGDRLLIRSGTYDCPASIAKALTFQGLGGVVLQTTKTLFFHLPIRIHSISAGKTVAFRDVEITSGPLFGNGVCQVGATSGAVIFDRVKILKIGNTTSGIHAERATLVALRNCEINTRVTAEGSRIVVEGGTFSGRSGNDFAMSDPAFVITNGELSLAESAVTGGFGAQIHTRRPPMPAVVAVGSRVMVRGRGAVLRAGQNHGTAEAVRGDATSSLLLDSMSTLTATTTATPLVTGFRATTKRALPVMRSRKDPVTGQLWEYELRGVPRSTYIVILGLPGPGIPLPSNESFLLHPATLVSLHAGTLDATGETKLTTRLSADPRWDHWTFLIQAATGRPGVFDLTNGIVLGQR